MQQQRNWYERNVRHLENEFIWIEASIGQRWQETLLRDGEVPDLMPNPCKT